MVDKYNNTKDSLHLMHIKHNAEKSSVDRDKEYRKILKELGFEKSEDEPITDQELGKIFISMQEDLFEDS